MFSLGWCCGHKPVGTRLFPLIKDFLDFSRQLGKNIIVGIGIVVCTFLLVHQGNVNQGHQSNDVVALTALVSLCVGVVALGDELAGRTVIFFFVTIDNDIDVFVVNV